MLFLDYVLIAHFTVNFIFAVIFLLYQFDVLDISESIVIHWCRFFSLFETVILITTRFINYGSWGRFGLGAFYILNIILLALQFIFAEFGAGRRILDILWILFYVTLFSIDICDISTMQIIDQLNNADTLIAIEHFLSNSFVGKFLIAILAPVIRVLLLEAVNKTE